MLQRLPVIVGPTAGGKTALGVASARLLAERCGTVGEIISADSIQVYRGLDIGSGKPSESERGGIAHHLIDVVEPTESYSVDQWLKDAERCIGEIRARGNVPMVVGGTHLYIKALLDGLFDGPPPNESLRRKYTAMPAHERRALLERIDPQAAGRIHPNDVRRTVRALEVCEQMGRPISEMQGQWDRASGRRDASLFVLDWPVELINPLINARVKQMVERGLVDEVRTLLAQGRLGVQAREALGYKQIAHAIETGGSLEEAIERVKVETRRFAKNQRTWLKRLRQHPETTVLPAGEMETSQMAQVVVNKILASV